MPPIPVRPCGACGACQSMMDIQMLQQCIQLCNMSNAKDIPMICTVARKVVCSPRDMARLDHALYMLVLTQNMSACKLVLCGILLKFVSC